ncbi:MAG: hypothetical protein JKY55_06520 [Aliivibrio sp.]|uniref:hypothetical protein n=1 Tax=Aliivibrio sp. TaxID=1872443 RepID=UPI001A5A3275|nr:hypothetical protein [Aliivibrio sp.]
MRKSISVVSKQNRPLNILADFLLENASSLIDKLDTFELIVGSGALLGSGEPPVTCIKIVAIIESPDAESEDDLEIIISLLNQRASELNIEISFEEQ